MVYLSFCLHHLRFLLSVSHSFGVYVFCLLGRIIPRYFVLFGVMVNGIISLISLFELSLLVYRNATDFYVLILYLATLPNSLMSSSSFLIASLGFTMYRNMSSGNMAVLLLLFQFGFLLFLFLL